VTTLRGKITLAFLAAGVIMLLVVELALGALHFGDTKLADPCTSKPAFSGGGIDGAVQRFALEGLNGAACELGTTREELVLSFAPASGEKIRWTRETIDDALRAGIDRAAHESAGGGITGSVVAFLLRELVAQPVEWFLDRSG
jgi:hypothetical protein